MSTDTVVSPRCSLAKDFECAARQQVCGFDLPHEQLVDSIHRSPSEMSNSRARSFTEISELSIETVNYSTPNAMETPKFGKILDLSWRKHFQESEERPKSTNELVTELKEILAYTDFLGLSTEEPIELLEDQADID